MTHDELLTKVDKRQYHPITGEVLTGTIYYRYLEALRAIVELHKPKEQVTSMNVTTSKVFSTQTICTQCSEGLGAYATVYPCPTIKAIEKELG